LYLVVSGSHAYGTSTRGSDVDARGVFMPPWRALLGLRPVELLQSEADDLVLHSARKFVRLCAQGNPNVLDWLFVPDDCVVVSETAFDEHVLGDRHRFLTRRLHARFRGYAQGHLQKMGRGTTRDLGAKRKADVEAHGYSTKNAMHMIRLLRMGCEVLESGRYDVRRPDAEELLRVRAGEWTLAEVEREGARLLRRLDLAAEETTLPGKVDDAFVDEALVRLTTDTLGSL
ncbi:hypothetical protein LCGC14_3124180, partial [marine sediment metagenome]